MVKSLQTIVGLDDGVVRMLLAIGGMGITMGVAYFAVFSNGNAIEALQQSDIDQNLKIQRNEINIESGFDRVIQAIEDIE